MRPLVSGYGPTLESVPAPEVKDEPTLRSVQLRTWRQASRELEEQIAALFDQAGTLPPAGVIKLMAELRAFRGEE